MTKTLSISRGWDRTKAIIARDGNLLFTVALALIVLPQVVVGLIDPPSEIAREPSTAASLVGVLAAFLSIIGQLAIIRLSLGPAISVGESIAHGARRFLPALLAFLLFGLALVLVMIPIVIVLTAMGVIDSSAVAAGQASAALGGLVWLVILITIALAARLMLLMPVASAERLGPLAILRRAWRLSAGHYWRLLAFLMLILTVAIALLLSAWLIGGVLANLTAGEVEPWSLGALVASLFIAVAQGAFTILSSVMLAQIYSQLAGAGGAEVSVPSSES